MKFILSNILLAAALLLIIPNEIHVDAFTGTQYGNTKRSVMTMKRGRGSFMEENDNVGKSVMSKNSGAASKAFGSGGAGVASAPSRNWVPVPSVSAKQISSGEEGKIQVIDTMSKVVMDGLVNPTGAVAVVKFGPDTFCFSTTCPCCKIPLLKSKVIPATEEKAAPRLVCDFCKATYDLKTGEKTSASKEESGNPGILGGIAKSLFSSSKTADDPIKIYALGEKGGKVLISL